MQPQQNKRNLFVALILLTTILALAPTIARADQQSSSTAIVINATGEATPNGSGTNQPATLTLQGNGHMNANKWQIIQNITGTLKIASANYAIMSGHGSVNTYGEIAIFANTTSGQLVLYGTVSGNSLTFTTPSQLASIASLSLNGTMNQTTTNRITGQNSSSATNATINSQRNATTTLLNETQTSNSTQISLPIETSSAQNVTLNPTSTAMNSTPNSSAASNTTMRSATNSTTLTGSVNTTLNQPPQQNVTVTVTQYVSLTSSATQTVANVTISYTATTTVANTTVTVGNVTTTVTSTTGT